MTTSRIPDPESVRTRPGAEVARLRAALATIAMGNVRSAERFAALVLDGASVDEAHAADDAAWRAEVGV